MRVWKGWSLQDPPFFLKQPRLLWLLLLRLLLLWLLLFQLLLLWLLWLWLLLLWLLRLPWPRPPYKDDPRLVAKQTE